MTTQEEAIGRRLSLYSFNKVFPNYLAQLQQLQSFVHRLCSQELNQTDKLSVEEIKSLREGLNDKYLEARNYLETERLSYNALDISLERTSDSIKNGVEYQYDEIRKLRDELNDRNERLNQMHLDIAAFNEESVRLNTSPTIIKYSKDEWINILEGPDAFDQLLEQRVFRSVGDGLYSVKEDLFDGKMELVRMNQIMKKDIERLKVDVIEYKQKWLENFEVMSDIGSIVRKKLRERRQGSAEANGRYEEEEDEDEDVVERVKNDGAFQSDDDLSVNSDVENRESEDMDEYVPQEESAVVDTIMEDQDRSEKADASPSEHDIKESSEQEEDQPMEGAAVTTVPE